MFLLTNIPLQASWIVLASAIGIPNGFGESAPLGGYTVVEWMKYVTPKWVGDFFISTVESNDVDSWLCNHLVWRDCIRHPIPVRGTKRFSGCLKFRFIDCVLLGNFQGMTMKYLLLYCVLC